MAHYSSASLRGNHYGCHTLTFCPIYFFPINIISEHKTKTIWRSRTHQGSGFNGFLQRKAFEDQTGSEQVYFRAQNDMLVKVLNDQTTNVGNDHTLNVENDSVTNVKMNQHFTVDGECRLTITKNKHSVSEAVYQRKVTQINRLEAKQEIHLKSGVKAVIEADQAITLKAGGNFITVDADGVHLMSPNVTLKTFTECLAMSGQSEQAGISEMIRSLKI